MFWWKGGGLWMGILVALVVFSAGQTFGPVGTPIGLLTAGVIVQFMKGLVHEESSLFSIPVRFWPWLLLVLAVLTFFGKK
jgi:hypothetical protein